MPDVLDSPLSELRSDLDRLRQLLALTKGLRTFAANDPPATNGDGEFGDASRSIRTGIRAASADLPVVSGTLLLYLAGRFEHFVRLSFQSLSEAMASKCQRFDDLPEKMRVNLRTLTAEVNLNPRKFGFEELEALGFLSALAANLTATAGIGSINSSCLSITQNNMVPGILADVYGRIGLAKIWSELGKQAALKTHFATATDADAEKEAKARLEDLMTIRNQIAHPNGSPSFPDPDQVDAFVVFISILASVLTDVSRVHLTAFKPPSAAT